MKNARPDRLTPSTLIVSGLIMLIAGFASIAFPNRIPHIVEFALTLPVGLILFLNSGFQTIRGLRERAS